MVTARQYISYIAESAGCFACIGRDGKLYFREIYQDETEISLELFADYKWGEEFKITKVSYEDGVRSFKFGDETRNNLWINQENMYIVDENQVQNIYNKINGLTANSFEGRTIIDPSIDIGDKITIDGKTIIYQGEMTLEGRFIAEISSKIQIKQKEETTVKKESQKVINRRVQSEINQIDGKITQLVEQTGEYDEKISKVEQDLDGITQQVANIQDFTREVREINQIHLSETVEGEGYLLNLKIEGNTENFVYLSPKDGLVPSNTLVPLGGCFTLVSDKQNRGNISDEAQVVRIILDEPLRNLNNVFDEFEVIDGKARITRRIGVNEDLSLYVLETEQVDEIGELHIKTFEGDTYIYVQEYSNLIYNAKYIIKNDYSENFVTNYDANSRIEQASNKIEETVRENFATKNELIEESSQRIQTAQEIRQEVSRKVGEDEVISKINQSAEEIQIEANKISLKRKRIKLSG